MAKGEMPKTEQVAEIDDLKETESVEVREHLGDEKANDTISKESGDKNKIKEPSSETEVQMKSESNETSAAKKDVEESQTDASTAKCGNTAELYEEKTSF